MTAFMFGCYRWKTAGYKFAHKPSRKMTLSMMDTFSISLVLVHGPPSPPPPPDYPLRWQLMLLRRGGGGQYRVGGLCRNGATRSRTFFLKNEQQGEL